MYHGHGMHGHHGNMCFRNFITKDEQIDHLECYKKSLESEIKGVDELIEKLKKES